MDDTTRDYFEQAAMWSGDHPAAVTILQAVQALIPDGTGSLLDVGCGDGALTNRLRDVSLVVGGDISLAALEHVRGPRINFSADALPFADDSFDIVIATDVIEHLPDDVLAGAMAEMARVARVGLVIAVPFREPAEYFRIDCASCGHRYHAHGHVRGYDVDSFTAVPGLCLAEWTLAGPRWTYTNELARQMRDTTFTSYEYPYGICPSCRTSHEVVQPPAGVAATVRRFDALQYLRCEHGLDPWPPPSELVALLTIARADEPAGPLAIDVAPERASGPWSLHLESDRRRDDPENFATDWSWIHDPSGAVSVMLPVRPAAVHARRGASGEVAIYDAVDGRYLPLDPESNGAAELALARPGPAGYVLRLLDADLELFELEIESESARLGVTPAELVGIAFGTEYTDRQLRSAAERIADLRRSLNDLAEQHEALVAKYEETWNTLQEVASARAALNDVANELEAQRAALEAMLSGQS